MFAQIYEHRSSLPIKIYLIAFLLALVVYFPIQAAKETLKVLQNQKQFISKLEKGPVEGSQLPLNQFFSILNQTIYSGKWNTSEKESKILVDEEQGMIEMKMTKSQQYGKDNEVLLIKVFKGENQDSGEYEIEIQCQSLRTQQKFMKNKVVYESIQPVVGQYRKKEIFSSNNPTKLFINRLIFIVSFENEIKISTLLAGGYDINIVTKQDLVKVPHFLKALLLSALLLFQIVMQITGILELYSQITNKGITKKGLAPTTILLMMCWDVSEILTLTQICYIDNINFAVFALPLGLSVVMVFILQCKLLSTLFQDNVASNDIQEQSSWSKYYFLIFGLLVFYYSNLHWMLFVAFSAMILTPQIVLNFKLGQKIKYQLSSLLKLVLPRFILLLYIRAFDANMFHLKHDYLLCLGCFLLLSIQGGLLFLQKRFGSRSILPKFLIPEKFQSFKFFMNEEENNEFECSICLTSLKSLPQDLDMQSQSIIYNKVVVTPCNHKFHFHCLEHWMESRLQCPNCRRILPPIDQ